MRSAALSALLALLLCPTFASAQAPLIYEGRLTTGDLPPDPWPALRFAIVDADDAVWWSTVVEPGGPVEVGPDGGFVAYLEGTPEAPLAAAGLDAPRDLFADGVTVDNCGDEGVQARNGGRARTRGATATANHEWGFAASTGSFLHCGDCTSRDNRFEGFGAHDLSHIFARDSVTSGNRGGYFVEDAGFIDAHSADPAAEPVGADPSHISR